MSEEEETRSEQKRMNALMRGAEVLKMLKLTRLLLEYV